MMRTEYLRFLQTLSSSETDVRKVANLVLLHFDELLSLTTAQGQRVKKFVELAQKNWSETSSDIHSAPELSHKLVDRVEQLKSLQVGPFRGFSKQENFDLSSSLVLIYGPNGTGKSSFCEALEYGLLGAVADAENKRLNAQNDYLKNAHTNSFTVPIITATDIQGKEIFVQSNEAEYRFCFVEKNRIDNFSHIAAQTPARQTELISTLFGLDDFNDFVRNFSSEIDGSKYIDLKGKLTEILNDKRKFLARDEEMIITNVNAIRELDAEENALANQYQNGITFKQMVLELRGDNEHNGKIKEIENELQQPLARKSELTISKLLALKNNILKQLGDINNNQKLLSEAGLQVSFKQLYEAVSQVQSSDSVNCPACKTPLHQVVVNPYTHASEEMQRLQYLAKVQHELKHHEDQLNQLLRELEFILRKCIDHYPEKNVLFEYEVSKGSLAGWTWLNQTLSDGITAWDHLEKQVRQLEESDQQIEQANQQCTSKQALLHSLREFDNQITQLDFRRATANKTITSTKQTIAKFEVENAQLIANAQAETAVVTRNKAIATAYSNFVNNLNEYKNKLPSLLVADLGEKVVEIYNAFNRNDSPSEKLALVRLPLLQNERLKISFQTNPDRYFDALHVLSEGHIRCIGLAILLAKNIKENCPLLIFDDPVNAIDDEHREAIRLTLFKDDFFQDKQIILACHGEEFFKDIQNMLSRERASNLKSFNFLPRLGEPHIRVNFNCAPRNYIIAARNYFNNGALRDALGTARQALEVITNTKLWGYVAKNGDGNLSIKMRSAKAPIELRNLTEQLKSKIEAKDFKATNKDKVLTQILILLGLDGNSREWSYLNKGVHEENERTEFDHATVDKILIALETLDETIMSKN